MDIGQQRYRPDHYWSLYNGTLAAAAAVAEYLELLYLNGMDTHVRNTPSWPRTCQLLPFIAVFPHGWMGQLASFGLT
jgi:hypothetical protein